MQQILKTSIIVLLAFFANYYLSLSHGYWLIFAAFFASFTSKGAPLRQSLITLMIMILFLIILSFTLLPAYSMTLLRDRIIDVAMGTVIAMFCSQFIFPLRIEVEFRQGLLPTLQFLIAYSHDLTERLLQRKQESSVIFRLQKKYPEWVFETGFNRGLRSGLRFFLIHLDYITELFCSLDYLATHPLDKDLLRTMAPFIERVMQQNEKLLTEVSNYLQGIPFSHVVVGEGGASAPDEGFTEDIKALQDEAHRILPASLELLDLSPDYVTLAAIVRDLADIRHFLLRLLLALPH